MPSLAEEEEKGEKHDRYTYEGAVFREDRSTEKHVHVGKHGETDTKHGSKHTIKEGRT